MKIMKILAIETSCDETAVAVIDANGQKEPRFRILANIISSQIKDHRDFGGVVPNLAARLHVKNLPLCLDWALKKAKIKMNAIDLIAVTGGPGLIPALLVGVNTAKTLAYVFAKPILVINHLEGHIYANFMSGKIQFPALFLLVSGGHTLLVLMRAHLKYKILGGTRDDAAGEAYDKVARLLGLTYPGGPHIEKLANQYQKQTKKESNIINFTSPMINAQNFDFSFSGLKTAVLYELKNNKSKKNNQFYKQQVADAFQQAVFKVLAQKTIKAAKKYEVKSISLAGGVAANKTLQKFLSKQIKDELPKVSFNIPSNDMNTDNAVMMAINAYYQQLAGKKDKWQKIKANANWQIGK